MRSSTSTQPSHLPSNYSTLITLHPTVTPRPEVSGRRWNLTCPMTITHNSQSLVQPAVGPVGLSNDIEDSTKELRDMIEIYLDISNHSNSKIQRTLEEKDVQTKLEKKIYLDSIIWSTNHPGTKDILVEVEHSQMSLNRASRIKQWAKSKLLGGEDDRNEISVSHLMEDDFKRVYHGCNCQYPCERDPSTDR